MAMQAEATEQHSLLKSVWYIFLWSKPTAEAMKAGDSIYFRGAVLKVSL